MSKITKENYFNERGYISYHSLKNFLKCEYLYDQKKRGLVPEITRDYFVYGHAFDSYVSGDFEKSFKVQDRAVNGEAKKETLKKYIGKANDYITKLKAKEKRTPKEEDAIKNSEEKVKVWEDEFKQIEKDLSDERARITSTTFKNVQQSYAELERQTLFANFLDRKKQQEIITVKYKGVPLKGMLDFLDLGKNVIADYKTAADLTRFRPENYTGQLAYYQWLVEQKYKQTCECYLVVVDKGTYVKRVGFWKFRQETLDAEKINFPEIIAKIRETEEVGIFEPVSDIRECYSCDHYHTCPHSIQRDFFEI